MRPRATSLTSNKRHGAGDLFFSARIGRTKNPAAPRNRKKVPGSPFLSGCNKFSLDVGVRRRSARPLKEHEFCAAHSLPAAPHLSRAKAALKRPESAQYESSGRKFPRRERSWLNDNASVALSKAAATALTSSRLSTGGPAVARKRTIMHFDSTKDDVLIFIHPRREIRSLKGTYTRRV